VLIVARDKSLLVKIESLLSLVLDSILDSRLFRSNRLLGGSEKILIGGSERELIDLVTDRV
jgi:hypothetical protein